MEDEKASVTFAQDILQRSYSLKLSDKPKRLNRDRQNCDIRAGLVRLTFPTTSTSAIILWNRINKYWSPTALADSVGPKQADEFGRVLRVRYLSPNHKTELDFGVSNCQLTKPRDISPHQSPYIARSLCSFIR